MTRPIEITGGVVFVLKALGLVTLPYWVPVLMMIAGTFMTPLILACVGPDIKAAAIKKMQGGKS